MLSVVKTVVLSAGNAEEIVIASEHNFISSLLMHFIVGIYSSCEKNVSQISSPFTV